MINWVRWYNQDHMESSPEDKLSPKRTPRRRAVRRRAGDEIKTDSLPKRVSPVKEEKKSVSKLDGSERKAPTMIAGKLAQQKRRKKQMLIAGTFLVIGVAASAAVGRVDQGWIDVEQTIEDRNERIRTNNTDEQDLIRSNIVVPVQDTKVNQKVDGGLVGKGAPKKIIKPPVVVSTSTATSSDKIATSTSEIINATSSLDMNSAPDQ